MEESNLAIIAFDILIFNASKNQHLTQCDSKTKKNHQETANSKENMIRWREKTTHTH